MRGGAPGPLPVSVAKGGGWTSGRSTVSVETAGGVAVVIIARPARQNAADGPIADRLCCAVRAADGDDAVAVIILQGRGERFCARADPPLDP